MYWYKRLAASAFYARGSRNIYFRSRQKRWWRSVEESHAIKKRRRLRRFLASGPSASIVTPVMLAQGINQIGQRFFEMSGMPNGVSGQFTGEIVHTLGGTWIWTGFSWESYIYPG